MANPSTAHEPSMEEILASIRQIISEDGQGATATRMPAPTDAPPGDEARTPAAPEPPTYESTVSRFDPVPAPPSLSENGRQPAVGREAPVRWEPDPHSEEIEPKIRPHFPPVRIADEAERLLSPEKGAVIAGAFDALAETMLTHQTRTLEDVVAEMLQPMLKAWLDNNLPSLVERMVREEIERVSRGRR